MESPSAFSFLAPVLLTFTFVHTFVPLCAGTNVFLSTISYFNEVRLSPGKSCLG